MIIPEDDGFPPVTTSNLNNFNNIMVVQVANNWKSSGETTYQLSTLDRSRGLSGWPADRYLEKLLPDHEIRVEQVNEPNKKEINLYADTSAVRPKLFCGREINYKFKRNHQNPSPKTHLNRTSLNARFPRNSRPANSSRSWKEKQREAIEPPKFDPPVKNRNLNFPRSGAGLLGDCPVARILPNAPGASLLPLPPSYSNFPPPPRENHVQNSSVYESKFEGMQPLKNFSCIKRKERESGHNYQGNYSQPGKFQGSRLNTSDGPYNKYTETERDQPCSSFRYDDSYNGNEASGRNHISPDMNNRNFKGNFRNEINSYENELNSSYVGNEALGRSHVSPDMGNREFRGNYRNEHSFENQREGFNNDRLPNNNQQSNYSRKSWQDDRKFVPFQKPKSGASNNSDYRRKKNSYFSLQRRPWASPMRAQSNPNRRIRRF